ncbi:helix-turn-helix domain-containing protein [Nocardiopsis chromatogenes]|uniref:helix-turn-helix domain-containing protein n=1 Tax=Nocardiopsis chromatogenes TaxID=280239 RepID=UPI00126851E8|nr:helix-turn-helix domain-containing protein [Nocardiopsis chromatogenes]
MPDTASDRVSDRVSDRASDRASDTAYGSALGDDLQARAAALLRSTANDLKRNDRDAEADLSLAPGAFAEYTSGRRPVTWELIERAARVWPVNERDLLPVRDDAPTGVRVCRAKESAATSRVIERGGGPYYEYRDTAMSRLSSYRPEWIRMLRTVDDDAPDNPAVEWNKGHLLYQFTYFVGPVNYYHEWEGVRHCVPMTTGDSVWGLPFGPHSFAARSDAEPAYILALTYGGDLTGDAQREIAALGTGAAADLALPSGADGALLASFLQARAMSPEELARRSGLSPGRVHTLCAGAGRAEWSELAALAPALGVSVRELLAPSTRARSGVSVRKGADVRRWTYPDSRRPAYRVAELAGDPLHPHTSALEVEVLTREEGGPPLTTHQHQYAYVLGDAPVTASWTRDGRTRTERLEPGDSAYAVPGVPLSLAAPEGGPAPRLLLLRIRGAVTPDVRFALGAMAADGIDRYVAEDRLWY